MLFLLSSLPSCVVLGSIHKAGEVVDTINETTKAAKELAQTTSKITEFIKEMTPKQEVVKDKEN